MGKSDIKENLDSFRKYFTGYEDCYTVIGGMACHLLMEDAGLDFRMTKDIDMILVLEDRSEDFSKKFWNYIFEGNYICGWKNNEGHYYRFQTDSNGYPWQIELFSRRNDFKPDQRIIPVHISEEIESLSAIALDNDFYDFMMNGRIVVDGISTLKAEYIIPFKMLAWLNNRRDKEKGIFVKNRDIVKHKNDIFRLYSLLNNKEIVTKGNVRKTIELFLTEILYELEDNQIEERKAIASLNKIYLN